MLKGFVKGLRRSGLLPKEKRESVVILNHNPADPKTPADVEFFASVEALVRELRANDLLEGGYYAVESTGRVVAMQPLGQPQDDPIEATMARHASEAQLAQRMIKHFLLTELEEESDDALDARQRHLIEREHDTARLLEMIPENVLTGR